MTLTNRVIEQNQSSLKNKQIKKGKFQVDTEAAYQKGEGFRSYYIQKIEELQLIVAEKSQNLRRLQAQRNELNAKGKKRHKRKAHIMFFFLLFLYYNSAYATRGAAAVAGTR